MKHESTSFEKIALLCLAGLAVIALALIAVLAIRGGEVDPNSAGLIGVIATGLIAFAKDIITAIRGYSMSAQLGKVTDQLAASGPAVTPDAGPTPVEVINTADNPVPVQTDDGTVTTPC